MEVTENVCPVCNQKNHLEASVCEHCGARLDDPLEAKYKTRTTEMQALTPDMIQDWISKKAREASVPESGIAFYIQGQSGQAHLDSREEFVLGRRIGTSSEKLLDLAPFGGYSMGLSRRHAIVRQAGDGYEVMDLGSVNGTWLNEERLVPHRSYPLPSSSHLRLGRMRLLVLYRPLTGTG